MIDFNKNLINQFKERYEQFVKNPKQAILAAENLIPVGFATVSENYKKLVSPASQPATI